jgi:arylformamidase
MLWRKRLSEIIDISVPILPGMPVWPGDGDFRIVPVRRIATGDKNNLSRLDCGVHTGTHVDAPWHFLEEGSTVEQLPLDALIGEVFVACLPEVDVIAAETLARLTLPKGTTRLLLHTRNSELWERGVTEFRKDFVALTSDAAQWLVDQGIRLIGVDYLSVHRYGDGPLIHQILLRAGIIIVEGLNLTGVAPGKYELICLPLRLDGADGAPARAVLRRLSERD